MMKGTRKGAMWAMAAAVAVACAPFARADLADRVTFSNAETNWVNGELVLVYSNPSVAGTLTLAGAGYGRILAVGGGGAGGTGAVGTSTAYGSGGGGGAGGFVATNGYIFSAGTYTINVGAGGAAANTTALARGNDGESTSVSFGGTPIVLAYGGGGGGAHSKGNYDDTDTPRGSGGGGSRTSAGVRAGGAATAGQGRAGGDGNFGYAGGGGGGAGAPGGAASAVGKAGGGGMGKPSDITGETKYYAGGGGGGLQVVSETSSTGLGGLGGGGGGGTPTMDAVAGTAGLGGGGGGGGGEGGSRLVGAAGGSGVVIVRLSEVLGDVVEKPVSTNFTYDGSTHVVLAKSTIAYTITGTASAINAGTYTFTARLKSGYHWGTDPTDTRAATVTWTVEKAQNYLTSLAIDDWNEGDEPSTPTCHYGFGTVIYTYSDAKNGVYTSEVPTEPGTYWLKAEIRDSANYTGATHSPVSFNINATGFTPVSGCSLFTEVAVDPTVFTTNYTHFPLLVRISEGTPTGFTYSQVRADGSDIRFCDIETGEPYPHEIDTWDPTGTSYIWVRVPELTGESRFYMCWGKDAGSDLPEVVSGETWGDYAGVWHFNEEISREEAAAGNVVSADSSSNGLDAKPAVKVAGYGNLSRQVSTNGVLGRARINADEWNTSNHNYGSGGYNGNSFKVDSYQDLGVVDEFTFSGWVWVFDYVGTQPCIVSRKDGHEQPRGWELKLWGSDNRAALAPYGGGYTDDTGVHSTATQTTLKGGQLKGRGFVHLALAYRGTQLVVYENGSPIATNTIEEATNPTLPLYFAGSSYSLGAAHGTADAKTTPLWGALDEFRILQRTADNDWIKADYEQMTRNVTVFTNDVHKGRGAVFENRWVTEPTLSKTSWYVGEEPGELIAGEAVHGTATFAYLNLADGTYTNEMPTAEGAYRIVFTIEGDNEYGEFTSSIDFDILLRNSYTDLSGDAEDTSSSGRILLMNRDLASGAEVENQGYYERDDNGRYVTQTNRTTFWHFDTTDTVSGYNLKPGSNSTLWSRGFGRKLWHLQDCRHGNTFPASDTALLDDAQNYLYWSTSSKRITAHSSSAATRSTVGQCVMRNVSDDDANKCATVYSPCYGDGIGTIYFDAVNGWTDNVTEDDEASPYRIVVEVATNVTGSTEAPYDDNIVEVINTYDEDEHGTQVLVSSVTNDYGNAAWFPVPATLYKMDAAAGEEREFSVTNVEAGAFALSVVNGGTTGNFYRVCIPLNITTPARFRIRRVSKSPLSADGRALILLDNIIVSFPSMRADLHPYGSLDESKDGKAVLGQECAFTTPFPAAGEGEVYGRAWATYRTNASKPSFDLNALVTSSRIVYRWRYLDQTDDGWKSSRLGRIEGEDSGFRSLEPLYLPDLPGDLEFFYEIGLNAPYYDYVDYSGLNLGVPGYSEAVSVVTNRAELAEGYRYPSGGTDWFVRLREGRSDYEAVNLVTAAVDRDGQPSSNHVAVAMELVGDHVWRGYLKTVAPTNEDDGVAAEAVYFRFEALNLQTPGAVDVANNVLRLKPTDSAMKDWPGRPASGKMEECDEDGWALTPLDYSTGYLMFQIDDQTLSIAIAHADYQNFNGWNDAKKQVFVGSSTEDGEKSGASSRATEVSETFSGWLNMPATNKWWVETISPSPSNVFNEAVYELFTKPTQTPNGWTAGSSMWVNGKYRDNREGWALQMKGPGEGYIQYVDSANSPRGLESVSFTARVGQAVDFDDFCYLDIDNKISRTNYTATALTAFDTNSSRDFSGNASLSLAAYYVPTIGCYEFRFEQCLSTSSGLKRGQRLALYRWNRDARGRVTVTSLGACTNDTGSASGGTLKFASDIPQTSGENGSYLPLFISVSNAVESTWIVAGFCSDATTTKAGPGSTITDVMGRSWNCVLFRDTSADRLTGGTMGVLSANCKGVFLHPYMLSAPVALQPSTSMSTRDRMFTSADYRGKKQTFKTTDWIAGEGDITSVNWMASPGRMEIFSGANAQWGLRGLALSQELNVYTAAAGSTDWKIAATTNFSSFGSSTLTDETCKFDLFTTGDSSLMIQTAGDSYDVRTDIVIDNLEMRQWRGDNWNNVVNYDPPVVPSNAAGWSYRALTNVTFTSGWITNRSVLLSAKRAAPNTPSSILSPLFDGATGWKRGLGLGMFSFRYANAQTNVNLLLQVWTNNVDSSDFEAAVTHDTRDDADIWTTVTNYSFAGMSPQECASGVRSCYLGMHGVPGMMRLVMDPKVVNAVSNVTDRSKFGEIMITEVFCRDEPALDSSSWWGWNLRTVGQDDRTGYDAEGRMYLPDYGNMVQNRGLSLALNNSVDTDVDELEAEKYPQHLPFVQTPTFGTNLVGEVAFRARRYNADAAKPAIVRLYGSNRGGEHEHWTALKDFYITSSTFQTYSYKTDPSETFLAFRLAVPGVAGVEGAELDPTLPSGYGYASPARVLLDEVMVSEAVRARMGFRNTGAFRSDLGTMSAVQGVPGEREQPLCGEAWGVQCEVYAAQLPDEIDMDRDVRVKLSWYPAAEPWGYDNWRTNAVAKSAWLEPAEGTNNVFRSGYLIAPGAVIDSTLAASGDVVQYMLEVVYYMVDGDKPVTNRLTAADWEVPPWYSPVNFNDGQGSFAAFNILDSVAPHWAWINEANVMGLYDEELAMPGDENEQFVEVAVPAAADITDWSVRILDPSPGGDTIVTNVLGVFGVYGLSATKADNMGMASNMVFRVLATPLATNTPPSEIMKKADGTLDATWGWAVTNYCSAISSASGKIEYFQPFGLQLVRPSGIVEHSVVCIGKDIYSEEFGLDDYNPTNAVAKLNRVMNTTNFFYVGSEDYGADASVGVLAGSGSSSNQWSHAMKRSPGRINVAFDGTVQEFPDNDPPTPNGTSIIVYSSVDTEFGHIRQTVGEAEQTTAPQIIVLKKGSETGTNITYHVDPWFELGTVTENGKPAGPATTIPGSREYVVTVGVGASNNVTVVAAAQVKDSLRLLGVSDDNPYKDAMIDWFVHHGTLYGDWENPDADEVKLAKYWPIGNTPKSMATDLTLTEMYWLDMDPTVGDLYLRGGWADPAHPRGGDDPETANNIRMAVKLYITNATDFATSPHYGEYWAPYVLRGLAPGETSWAYKTNPEWNWTSVTFKVSGIIQNGQTSTDSYESAVPLRYFVFNEDSFDEDCTSRIEVKDPRGPESPAVGEGWDKWPDSNIFYLWQINRRRKQWEVENLEQENYYP